MLPQIDFYWCIESLSLILNGKKSLIIFGQNFEILAIVTFSIKKLTCFISWLYVVGAEKNVWEYFKGRTCRVFHFYRNNKGSNTFEFCNMDSFFFTTNKQGLVSKTLFRKTFSIKILHYKFLETVGNNKVF